MRSKLAELGTVGLSIDQISDWDEWCEMARANTDAIASVVA